MPQWLINPWRLLLVLALVSMLALGAACGDDDDDDDEPSATEDGGGSKEPLKIGALMSFTGPLGTFGEPIFSGAQLAVDEINANGGVLGNDVTLVRADDGTNPDQGVTEAQRLVDVEGVQAIVGALASGVTVQVAETVTGPAQVLTVSPAATGPALSGANDDDFLFRTTISDAGQGLLLSQLANEQSLDNICNLYVNSPYGEGLSNAFTAAFEEKGGTITAEVPHEDGGATYATELGQCGDAQTLAAISYPETANVYLREAVESGKFSNYLFVDGTKQAKMFETLGYANFDGMTGTSPSSLPTGDANAGFIERYEAVNGPIPPTPYIKEAYDAVYLIALAAIAAESTDGADMQAALRDVANAEGTAAGPGPEGFTAAVESLEAGDDINYDGASGPFEFDVNGDPQIGAIEFWHVDAAAATLVSDRVFQVDFDTGEVTDITELVLE